MIGYKNNTVISSESKLVEDVSLNDIYLTHDVILRMKAFELINKALDEYLDFSYKPFIVGDARDVWFQETLSKIRKRYLEPI